MAEGMITSDPALNAPLGLRIKFTFGTVNIKQQEKTSQLADWGRFEGTLIYLNFASSEKHEILGSGVLVAPGIALIATHVITGELEHIINQKKSLICHTATQGGLQTWRAIKVTRVPNTDLTILGLEYASALPADRTFALVKMTTRLPRVGETLTVAGFKSDRLAFIATGTEQTYSGQIWLCSGEVKARYYEPSGRDSFLLPFPVLEFDCPSYGGMSGGPVFDSKGFLVGILASSFEDGPSYVSLLYPALGCRFEGGWPAGAFQGKMSLLEISGKTCIIDRPEVLTVHQDKMSYTPWEE